MSAEPVSTELESGRFVAAPADLPTKALTVSTLAIFAALVLGGAVQVMVSTGEGDALGVVRGLGYGLLALLGGAFTLARAPQAYRLEVDAVHGAVLVVERRWSRPVRLALGRYREAVEARRVIFPWVPMLSGTRVFGLRGARIEESLAGFWSFGRDGRRALILSGPGRPRTLVSPRDPQALLRALARLRDGTGPSVPAGGETSTPRSAAQVGGGAVTRRPSAPGGLDTRSLSATPARDGDLPPRRPAPGGAADTLTVAGCRIVLTRGDITVQEVDGIVNAANSSLMGGGGVDGAIHGAGGPEILEECLAIVAACGPLPPGESVVTTAGLMADHGVRRVIHTVGPVWRGGAEGEEATLRGAYRSSLAVAVEEGLRTVAFPSISTGAYGYPVREAAKAALSAVAGFLEEHPGDLDEVRFVLFDEESLESYRSALESTSSAL